MNTEKPWVNTVRRQSGVVEHICKCGVGHPAYGSIHWMKINGKEHAGVHACCGCCQSAEWKLADAIEGVEVANKIILSQKNLIRYLRAGLVFGEITIDKTPVDDKIGNVTSGMIPAA